MKKLWVAAVVSGALILGGCSSWDAASPTTEDLSQQLTSGGVASDGSVKGLAQVGELDPIEPVTDSAKPNLPVSLTDADGHQVEVTDVSRIVALDLYGTYTKTLAGLGLGDNIVGKTVSSTEQNLSDVPTVTAGGHDINVEAVLNLKPTLVIVDHSIGPREAIDQIRAAGVPTVVMKPSRTLATIGQDIRDVAGVVGLGDTGEDLAKRSEAEVEQAREAIASIAPEKPIRMAFLYARGTGGVFYVLGAESGTQGLIEALGGEDVASAQGIGAPQPANAEALAELNPDLFVMMSSGLESTGDVEGLLQRPGIAQTTAGQNQAILALPDGASLAFGPQTGELLLRAAQELYSDRESE